MNWQERFSEQLKWTEELRSYIYTKIDVNSKKNLLDIGCGTGDLLKEIGSKYNLELYGIDKDNHRIKIAEKNLKDNHIKVHLFQKDFLKNNFPEKKFDIVVTSYFFLWVKDLEKYFKEIYRILQNDGIFLILSEPDYGGLIEHPNTNLKEAICLNLKKEGADPEVGRKLNNFFTKTFSVEEKFFTSTPWISNIDKEGLLKEQVFFSNILKNENYNPNEMKININQNNYFLFIPIFSYYLKKI